MPCIELKKMPRQTQ